MSRRLEARAAELAGARVAAIVARIAAAELPAGLIAERDGDSVVIRGRGLVRRLAFDARLRALALIGRAP